MLQQNSQVQHQQLLHLTITYGCPKIAWKRWRTYQLHKSSNEIILKSSTFRILNFLLVREFCYLNYIIMVYHTIFFGWILKATKKCPLLHTKKKENKQYINNSYQLQTLHYCTWNAQSVTIVVDHLSNNSRNLSQVDH